MLYFALYSNFCFACFASQTLGLCSAISSAPVKFVARFCLIFLYSCSNFCFACLKASQTSGLCSAFPSAPVESVTRFRKNFVLRVLPYKHRVCAVLFLRLPYSLLHAFVVTNLCFVLFTSPTSGLCSAFPFGSPQVYTLFFFVLFSLLFLCVLCPTSSGQLCSGFFPAPLEFALLIFLLCTIQF